MKKNIIFVGWVNQGRAPVDGETTKNQYIIAELEKYCNVYVLDFYQKKRHPWIYLQAAWTIVAKPKAVIVFSTSASNVFIILRLFYKLGLKRDIINWVIGGNFATHVKMRTYSHDCDKVFNYINYNLVQCHSMIAELEEAGVHNGKFVSNFKPIKYFPDLNACHTIRDKDKKTRFVFLSRIKPEKGCDYIFQAAKQLNKEGFKDRYIIDFYGKIDTNYVEKFDENISSIENIHYNGLLVLTKNEGYDVLATYHAMLFPTYWHGEGFAGIFIDAFIAGLPVLASDWAHNPESIIDGKQGVIYPTHDVAALTNVMKDCIMGKIDLETLSLNSRNEASKYQAENVITKEYLQQIGLICK